MIPSQLIGILFPNFLKRIDRYFLLNYPRIWVTKIVWIAYYGLIANLLVNSIVFCCPMTLFHRDRYWLYLILIITGEIILLFWWSYKQMIYSIEKDYGINHPIMGLGEFLLSCACIALILSLSATFILTIEAKMEILIVDWWIFYIFHLTIIYLFSNLIVLKQISFINLIFVMLYVFAIIMITVIVAVIVGGFFIVRGFLVEAASAKKFIFILIIILNLFLFFQIIMINKIKTFSRFKAINLASVSLLLPVSVIILLELFVDWFYISEEVEAFIFANLAFLFYIPFVPYIKSKFNRLQSLPKVKE